MVVSVEISGILEEKLRRLVDLGLYASVAEAVRDGVRKLLSELDFAKIAADLYTRKNMTLAYACELSGLSCQEFIDYLILNRIQPLIGSYKLEKNINNNIILDIMSMIVLFDTGLYDIFIEKLNNFNIKIFILNNLKDRFRMIMAYAYRRGLIRNMTEPDFIRIHNRNIKIKNSKKIILLDEEASIAYAAKECGCSLITPDVRFRDWLRQSGIHSYCLTDIFYKLYEDNLISIDEMYNIFYKLKTIPLILPPEYDAIVELG